MYFYVFLCISMYFPAATSHFGARCQTKGQKPDFQPAELSWAPTYSKSQNLVTPNHHLRGKMTCNYLFPQEKPRTKTWQSPGFPTEAAAALVLPPLPSFPQLLRGTELLTTSTPSPSSRSRRSVNFTDIRTSNEAAWVHGNAQHGMTRHV